VHVRPLGSGLARLSLERHLPLRIGDRALVRDPGSRALWGLVVLDPSPPALGRRGAAMRRATELAEATGDPDLEAEVARRGLTRASFLRRLGVGVESAAAAPVTGSGVLRVGDWLISDARASALRLQLARVVREQHAAAPLEPGVPLTALAAALAVPDPTIVAALVEPPLRVEGGRVAARPATQLPAEAEHALEALTAELEDQPFMAPTADRLRELRLDTRTVAAAAKLGRLLRLDDGIVLAAGADRLAVERLRELPSPFTLSEARMRLNSTRRVMLPLLAHLDRQRWTRRLPDDRRVVTGPLGDTEAG
jgi:selenocysteine-specific elongation factor